jgi:hypothetical protein
MTKDERLEKLEQDNELLRTTLTEVAEAILKALEPDAMRAVEERRRSRAYLEEQEERRHGPYCAESTWREDANRWLYCGERRHHRGPCNYVRAVD